MTGQQRFETLDGLRGFAALLVLWGHAPPFLFSEAEKQGMSAFWRAGPAGTFGVDLFFVVSGFLITGILLDAKAEGRPLSAFWIRRAARILPLATGFIALLYALSSTPWAPPDYAGFGGWAHYLLFVGNFYGLLAQGPVPAEIVILWSLAIEEQFYLVWPWLVRGLSGRRLALACSVVVLASPALRAVVEDLLGRRFGYNLTPCRLDGLASGALLALLWRSRLWTRARPWLARALGPSLLGAGLLLSRPVLGLPAAPAFLEHVFSNLVWTGLVASSIALPRDGLWFRALSNAPLAYVGRRCYGTYVWHLFVARSSWSLLRRAGFEWGIPFRLGFVALVLLAVVELSWRLLESPFQRLARSSKRGRREPGAAASIRSA